MIWPHFPLVTEWMSFDSLACESLHVCIMCVWRCDHARFCVDIFMRHNSFIHSLPFLLKLLQFGDPKKSVSWAVSEIFIVYFLHNGFTSKFGRFDRVKRELNVVSSSWHRHPLPAVPLSSSSSPFFFSSHKVTKVHFFLCVSNSDITMCDRFTSRFWRLDWFMRDL